MRERWQRLRQIGRERGFRGVAYEGGLRLALDLASALLAPFRRPAHGDPYYAVVADFVERVNALPSPRVLELGSRNVTGVRHRSQLAPHVEVVGVDVHAGEDVDVVGDVHELARLVPEASFDAAFAISVFEHLAMPWKVVLEINRVLKPGGLLLIATHPAWPPHELPWDFWRFSPEALRVLLNPVTGFEVLRREEGEPARLFALTTTPPVRGMHRNRCWLAVAALARKIGPARDALAWDVDPREIALSDYGAGGPHRT